jgi:transcriptional regulator with XRE-family HTH domain
MTGVKYYRILNQLSREKLAEITGISIGTIKKMERISDPSRICSSNYRRVSKALEVSVEDLIKSDYPDSEDGGPVRAPRKSRADNKCNCISIFRTKKGLTYERLAYYMGFGSRQRAHQLCCSEEDKCEKHIEILSRHENISTKEFKEKYSA